MAISNLLKNLSMPIAVAALVGTSTYQAQAATITNGFTFSVANSGGSTGGSHFHSSSNGVFGNPAGKAEVGSFFNEDVRGLSEYNLAGLTSGSAFITFDVFKAGGLFAGENDFPFTGNIDVVAYAGNNTEDIWDFQALNIGTVGTFNTASLSVGNILSFDISSIFNNALGNGATSLGIRLQTAAGTDTRGGAWVFDDFRITSTDDSTNPKPVPEPASTLGLLAFGAMGAGSMLKRKQQKKATVEA